MESPITSNCSYSSSFHFHRRYLLDLFSRRSKRFLSRNTPTNPFTIQSAPCFVSVIVPKFIARKEVKKMREEAGDILKGEVFKEYLELFQINCFDSFLFLNQTNSKFYWVILSSTFWWFSNQKNLAISHSFCDEYLGKERSFADLKEIY